MKLKRFIALALALVLTVSMLTGTVCTAQAANSTEVVASADTTLTLHKYDSTNGDVYQEVTLDNTTYVASTYYTYSLAGGFALATGAFDADETYYELNSDADVVEGAVFSAYQVMSYSETYGWQLTDWATAALTAAGYDPTAIASIIIYNADVLYGSGAQYDLVDTTNDPDSSTTYYTLSGGTFSEITAGTLASFDLGTDYYVKSDNTATAYKLADTSSTPESGKTYYTIDGSGNFVDAGTLASFTEGTNYYVITNNVGTATIGNTSDYEKYIAVLQAYINDENNSVTANATATTDADGVATFNTLGVGVYLVTETYVPDGYIVTTQSFMVSLPQWDNDNNTWDYSVDAYPKDYNYKDTVEKTITASTDLDGSSYSVGDTVNYTVKGEIPDYGNSLTDSTVKLTDDTTVISTANMHKLPFIFNDEFSDGLTYTDSLKVYIDLGTAQPSSGSYAELTIDGATHYVLYLSEITTEADKTDYEKEGYVVDSDTDYLNVSIHWISLNAYQGYDIYFTYTAQVNADASVTDPNTNTATVSVMSNVSTFTGDFDGDSLTTSEDVALVYTYRMDLTKTFEGQSATDANVTDTANVTFTLSDSTNKALYFIENSSGNYTLWTNTATTTNSSSDSITVAVKTVDTNTYYLCADGSWVLSTTYDVDKSSYTLVELTSELHPSSTGSLVVSGLSAGEYLLDETTSASGYSVLSQAVTITVSETNDVKDPDSMFTSTTSTDDADYVRVTTEVADSNGVTTSTEYIQITSTNKLSSILTSVFGSYSYTDNSSTNGTYTYVDETKDSDGNVTKTTTTTVQLLKATDDFLTASIQHGQTLQVTDNGTFAITVNNSKSQFNLPLTGGAGLWIFTILGAIVMAAAIIYFSHMRGKKKAAQETKS